ncbi:MAG: signal peptide peptidase SppA [Candidatus Altiarchaeota archaeon]|nr:signal peptide peptidase SppA [Candidatus Altiarchaeota archaeon]
MKTIWKVLITFGVFVLFLFAMIGVVMLVGEVFTMPSIGNKVAVIPIKGEITLEDCGGSIFGSYQCAKVSEIKEKLKKAEEDPMVKAIVLDINSGGGGVVASTDLMQAIRGTSKPTVAYISESGASGAYYAASASDWIIADRNAITGSIGVIMTLNHYYGLYGKLGINVTVIKSGDSKDIGSPYRPITEEEKRELEEMIDKIYDDLKRGIAENRKDLSLDDVEKLADGTIYLGSEAKLVGLIDDVGSMDDAIRKAAELGGIEGEPEIQVEETGRESILDLFT